MRVSRIIFTDFWRNQIQKPKKILNIFCHKADSSLKKVVKLTVLSTMAIKLS